MGFAANEDCKEGTPDEQVPLTLPNAPRPPRRLREFIRINIPPLPMPRRLRLLNPKKRQTRLLDFLRARPSREWLKAPLAIFRRTANEREDFSRLVPSPVGIRRRFHLRFLRKINWDSLLRICKEWMKNPVHISLLIWLFFVAGFGILLFLLMTGLVDSAFPTIAMRNRWIEICYQVINALFTLMSLYQHPNFFYHIWLLCRWRSDDIIELRKLYCKNGAYRPHEFTHMMVVVTLLHITCFAQYALCGLYWGFKSETRPEFGEAVCSIVGLLAPVLAGVYTVYSPLGREFESESDEESQAGENKHSKLGLKLYDRKIEVSRPEWIGGLYDLKDDMMVAYLSFFCTCCVFGWNMERLGFGNMYVHMATFLLLCIAPFWIFGISALNMQNDVVRITVIITGLVLCLFGFLYGGFWRIQIRKRFKLPKKTFCCGSGSMTDYIQWMFCWSCALAQEVRTGNYYDVEDDGLYRKHMDGDDDSNHIFHPLPREGGTTPLLGSPLLGSDPIWPFHTYPIPSPMPVPEDYLSYGYVLMVDDEEKKTSRPPAVMVPPVPLLIQFQDGSGDGDSRMELCPSPKFEGEETLLQAPSE